MANSTMKLTRPGADIFVPGSRQVPPGSITRLGIGAHQDDLEFMAFDGIAACHGSPTEVFGGVVCTDGAGSARRGPFAHHAGEQMRAVRREEQRRAAGIGCYGVMVQLDFPSAAVKDPRSTALVDDLLEILRATRPRVVYTHNLADKHDTHVAVAVAAIRAMRALPAAERPACVHGCEVWRGLDWLGDAEKIVHDLSGHEALASALNGVFRSQIDGGKRYDLGVAGRRRANATFLESHEADQAESAAFAMDLTPLVRDPSIDIVEWVDGFTSHFRADVRARLQSRLGRAT